MTQASPQHGPLLQPLQSTWGHSDISSYLQTPYLNTDSSLYWVQPSPNFFISITCTHSSKLSPRITSSQKAFPLPWPDLATLLCSLLAPYTHCYYTAVSLDLPLYYSGAIIMILWAVTHLPALLTLNYHLLEGRRQTLLSLYIPGTNHIGHLLVLNIYLGKMDEWTNERLPLLFFHSNDLIKSLPPTVLISGYLGRNRRWQYYRLLRKACQATQKSFLGLNIPVEQTFISPPLQSTPITVE